MSEKQSTSLEESTLRPELQALLDQLPKEPGVYLFKDRHAKVLYVGKAKSLFSRVRSYFLPGSSDTRAFVPLLATIVGDIDTIITANEKEALLLENTLIKKYRPRYNVVLRDDKNYLVLRLDLRADYPRLEITRRILNDGARYFGPYHSAAACRQTLRLINRHFKLRVCTDQTMKNRVRPCLQYQIKRCLGPCVYQVDKAQYEQQVRDVILFLRGRQEELIQELEQRRQAAADALEFEAAAQIRDQIAAVRTSLQDQQVVSGSTADQDIFGYYRESDQIEAVILLVREGKLVERRSFSLSNQEFPDEEMLSGLIGGYYDRGAGVPAEILLPLSLSDGEVIQEWLGDLRGGRVKISVPRRGGRTKLLELARRNAAANFRTRRQKTEDQQAALAKIQQRLHLTKLPLRIECFDISSFQGQLVVASMVVMQDGQPLPRAYRRFQIDEKNSDDFAALYEALSRRFRRAREKQAGWELPDLLVVDGGKAQLSTALAALRDIGLPADIAAPDIIGLAKYRAEENVAAPGEESVPDRVFLPHVKDPVLLRPNTVELFLLARLRDEAHRFAITYHRAKRRRLNLRSSLEDIPGIGHKRRKLLLRHLGSLQRIKAASVEELADVPGMTLRAAESIAKYFSAGELSKKK